MSKDPSTNMPASGTFKSNPSAQDIRQIQDITTTSTERQNRLEILKVDCNDLTKQIRSYVEIRLTCQECRRKHKMPENLLEDWKALDNDMNMDVLGSTPGKWGLEAWRLIGLTMVRLKNDRCR